LLLLLLLLLEPLGAWGGMMARKDVAARACRW
jgi:hypothetical protein